MATSKRIKALCDEARRMGALDAVIVSPQKVFTATWVRLRCQYGCSEYGQCLTCPPHSPTPETTRKMLDEYRTAILLHASDWKSVREVGQPWNERPSSPATTRRLPFCADPATSAGRVWPFSRRDGKAAACQHPDQARPAMEAAGVTCLPPRSAAAGLPIDVVRSEECPQNYYALVLVE